MHYPNMSEMENIPLENLLEEEKIKKENRDSLFAFALLVMFCALVVFIFVGI